MDSQSVVETLRYNSSQKPFFNVIETPVRYKPFAAPTSGLLDLSFSSYIQNEPLEKSSKDPQTASDDSEINVFDAQKYFSESNDSKETKTDVGSSNLKPSPSPNDSVSVYSSVSSYGRNFRTRSFRSTPTASSEASWNSQKGLLSKPPVLSADHHSQKRSSSAAGKWFFCRKCPCAGKKSLQVKEEESSAARTASMSPDSPSNLSSKTCERMVQLQKLPKVPLRSLPADELSERHKKMSPVSSRIQSDNHIILSSDLLEQRIRASSTPTPTPRPFGDSAGGFSFPVLKSPKDMPLRTSGKNSFEEPPRKSLDVFQPTHNLNPRKAIDDDVGSDASSDLFEIESFSTQTTSYRRRDSLDEAATLHAGRFPANNLCVDHQPITLPTTECYAPSEVSIDWSVTTAEGFDKASMTNLSTSASEFEDWTISKLRSTEKYGEQAASGYSSSLHGIEGGGCKKKIGNGFLGCRHEKAVSVGPNPMKIVQVGPPSTLISAAGHVRGGASRPPKPHMPQSARGHSSRLSLAFAA